MTQYQPTQPIVHNLSNEDYRSAPGDSATFLKGCLRSVKHAKTPKKRTKAMDTGLHLHTFILERELFLSKYVQGLNPEDYPDALFSAEELKEAAKKFNETRKPKLKTTGSKELLLSELGKDDKQHLEGVDVASLSATDIKNQIKHINEQPNRGIIALSGSSMDLYARLTDAGFALDYFPALVAKHASDTSEEVVVLPYDEYKKYEDMYQSLITHLRISAEVERETESGSIMQWLHYAFTTPGVMETEVSMFGKEDKCRMDLMFQAGDSWIACDLKSASDASEEGFSKQAARLHYDLQSDHYSSVSAEVDRPLVSFPFIAIETEEPYATSVFIPTDEFQELGSKKRKYAKKKIAEYKQNGYDTAYQPVAKALTPPAWASYGPWAEE